MPYRRKHYRQRRSPLAHYAAASAPAIGYVAMKAAKLVARKYLNVEHKIFDTNGTVANSTSVGAAFCLNSIVQGADENERNGNSIKASSLFFRLGVVHDAAGDAGGVVRMMIIRDNMCDGTTPLVTHVLELNSYVSPLNMNVDNRYTVLWDKTVTTQETIRDIIPLKKYMKMTSHIKYVGATAAIGSMGQGSLFFLYIAEQPVYGPSIKYWFRLKYLDN